MKKTKILIIITIIFLTGGILYMDKINKNITNYPAQNSNSEVVIFGDSLARGYGSIEGNDPATLISNQINEKVLNLGVSGDTTNDALERLNQIPQSPKMAIIILGGNDVLKDVPKDTVYENMREIIQNIQNRGTITAIGSVKSSVFGQGSLTEEYEKIADDTGSIFLGNVLRGLYGEDDLMSDRIHPNNAGYKIMSDRIIEKIEPYLE